MTWKLWHLSSLDIGCRYAPVHVKRGEIGVDIKRGTCDVLASAYYLPFKNNCFEKAIMSHVLEHVTGCVKVLEEVARVLIDEGILQIEVPNPYNFGIFKDILLRRSEFYKASKDHIHAFGENELRNLLSKLKFQLISIRYINSVGTERKLKKSSWLEKAFYNLILSIFPPFRTAIEMECRKKS